MIKVINNSNKYHCGLCGREITGKRKVRVGSRKYYHLSCYYNWVVSKIKLFRKERNRLSRYKKDMVLERLR